MQERASIIVLFCILLVSLPISYILSIKSPLDLNSYFICMGSGLLVAGISMAILVLRVDWLEIADEMKEVKYFSEKNH